MSNIYLSGEYTNKNSSYHIEDSVYKWDNFQKILSKSGIDFKSFKNIVEVGCGAGQIKIIVVGILFALLIIYIYHIFYNKKNSEYAELINLAIIIDEDVKEDDINKIINEIKLIAEELNFISMSKTQNVTSLNLDIRPKNFNEILKITSAIKSKYKKSKTIIARNSNLNL